MLIFKKKISLLISFVLLLGAINNVHNYYKGVKSMNNILDSYNVYYKNKISHTYAILEKNQKHLVTMLMDYNWNVQGVRQLTKDKLIVYLQPSSSKTELIFKEPIIIETDNTIFNLVYIK